jgi:hypothetical protein
MLVKSIKVHKKGLPKETGIVIGFNVKCISTDTPRPRKTKPFQRSTFTWGFVLTLALKDGTEIDCIWEMVKTKHHARFLHSMLSGSEEPTKHGVNIPYILMKVCGVTELKDVIGTTLKVRRTNDSVRVRCNDGYWVFADMFEIHELDYKPMFAIEIPESMEDSNDDADYDSEEESESADGSSIGSAERVKLAADLIPIRIAELQKMRRPAIVHRLAEIKDELLTVLGAHKTNPSLVGEGSEDSLESTKMEMSSEYGVFGSDLPGSLEVKNSEGGSNKE